ncbi:hypothetical protein J8J14_13775 [Roseomonas sp. SSH11]|uniref:Uncharacterized protein n=1 Tax=Pararoseomonas baculiformis TaxID=2820812 RepID=A0ABS4AFN9_9PROT|nr:hypothetical protein [Pararoseomonas baculiformis]MBP0445844.1 hypothetical protein [Pararoseomonas baculiformis]
MTLPAVASVTLGRQRYDSHALGLEVQLGLLPSVNRARITLPRAVAPDAAPGDPAELSLRAVDGSSVVLHGTLHALSAAGAGATEAVLADDGARLAALRPCRTYQGQDGGTVVRALAEEAGAGIGALELDLPLAAYVAHGRRSAAEHVATLAKLGGALAGCDEAGRIELRALPSRAERALRYDREILALRVTRRAAPEVRQVMLGNGPAASPEAPDALLQSRSPLPADAPPPGAQARWLPAPALRSPRAALAAGQARDTEAASRATRVEARAILLPWLRPGMVLEIQQLPDRLDAAGPWLVLTVCHARLAGAPGETRFTAVSAAAGPSLLASLASAVGGLL